ncbi:hypothetical protein HDV05_002271 [Chytridiales sp. JEL 0842]|nr:hypothetical protein HDV05_002271 [Chytridiales sp. JEL 0842]
MVSSKSTMRLNSRSLIAVVLALCIGTSFALPWNELERRGGYFTAVRPAARTTTTTTTTTTRTTTLLPTPNPTPLSSSVVEQALVLTKVGGENAAKFTLEYYDVPHLVITVPSTGISQLNLEVAPGKDSVNGLWQNLLTPTQVATLHSYLARYNVKLVKLNDNPDPSTGVTNVGWGTGIDHPIAFAPNATSLATNVALHPTITFSSDGLYHYPGSISNPDIARPVLFFKAVAPEFPVDTVAAAHINITVPGVGTGWFQQLSFYLPFNPEVFTTSVHLGKVWLNWVSNKKYPPTIQPLTSFTVTQKVLLINGIWDDCEAVKNILLGYSMPFDQYTVGDGNMVLETVRNSVGAYSLIVSMTPLTALTPIEQRNINAYLTKYNVRLVLLNDIPDPASGVNLVNGQGSGSDQRVYFSPQGTFLARNAGIQPSIAMSTAGLFHYPSRITNDAIATPMMFFEPSSAYPNPTVAAALITFPGYQQLSFYLPFGFWSLTSMVLSHAWFAWGTRGFYPGYRRIMFSAHVDDVFLATDTEVGRPPFRLRGTDMSLVQRWQADLNSRMNAGSKFKLELAFNGNGVYAEVAKRIYLRSLQPVDLADEAYIVVDKSFKKPLGTGIDVWRPINLKLYTANNAYYNLGYFRAYDSLFNFIHSQQANYFLSSHTFTHEDLNNCSYRDAFNEVNINRQFARGVGWESKPWFSSHSMVSPGISGVFNGDALRAFTAAGLTSVVGDITRPAINNNTNIRWPWISSIATSNFAGFHVIPRAATAIYYNCSTPKENEELYAKIYPKRPLNFTGILNDEVQRAVYKLMNLHWDAYMFHQANLRVVDVNTTVNPPYGPTTAMSSYNKNVTVAGTNNGATRAYRGGNISILSQWVEAVLQSFNQLVSWPMVTYKLDDMEDMFRDRVIRENAGVTVNVTAGVDGFTRFTIGARQACTAPISFPLNIVKSNIVGLPSSWKVEKLGSDPLTVWVPLNGRSPVTITLNTRIAF